MTLDGRIHYENSRDTTKNQISTVRKEIQNALSGWNEIGQEYSGELFGKINGYKTLNETIAAIEIYRNDLALIGEMLVHDKGVLAQRRLITWDVLKRLKNLKIANRIDQESARSPRFFKSDRLNGDEVVYLFDYKRKSVTVDESKECVMSEKLRKLKNMETEAIGFFSQLLLEHTLGNFSICTVPGHTRRKKSSGIREVASKLSREMEKVMDATDTLERYRTIKKQAFSHRKRNIKAHLESIRIKYDHDVQGKDILLLDDVGTSEWSLAGCRKILMEAGSNQVKCAVLGRTVHPDATNFSDEMRRAVKIE